MPVIDTLAKASGRLRAFAARRFWRSRGEPAELDGYEGARPWIKPLDSWDDVRDLRAGYDELLAHFGPRADIALPRPPANMRYTHHSISRNDIFYHLSIKDCGATLAGYGRLRLEDAACARGEWVPDRSYNSIHQLVRPRAARWKRMVDGELKTTGLKPAGLYVADLRELSAALDAHRPNRPAPARFG